ncbi:bifunctional DNA-formamidopyrimidine glycosylase/DNA-(apurinic or apyrimidinic site) lyase [Shewanella amazonensis]|uniref:Formamidopyrimidine-DNA glycosylase n=1 Tax=Shewanella amazonensis (strain ATCC BAA-1098 / SB2B) TaxID=326297 RepID=FPG_SHEAM|nr:bifunctional DNA-formamidopyrimidine glycosylase/DNA-(apurinic or apyrimidinic site) lyase [Shewanella amazonensis]A1S1S3.1 RecName: Full=Formamidopyrimidine-DNA glycosylase; Short=Fapy-DNA glycosylase; AltName: Full=DNA-(apurinic or apyrimidinic site) lyase MutM; Short=AP lyase MutM [Shewanella amazonensis SB2B]ABL98329.1 DNA-(apurinic or apyrimidinic site) lyase / Formamidopyrimidine-DNA glycosylase [Shewanella amazonensis SB2B]
MPELPEVEVTRQGIAPHLEGNRVEALIVRNANLRWPVPELAQNIVGQTILGVRRRAKYLLIDTQAGTTIVHLGMSGSLRVLPKNTPVEKHDHIDLVMQNGRVLRFNDPRRFGAWLWSELPEAAHPLLEKLGPEPLSAAFHADYLQAALKGKKKAIKLCLMDNAIVVGVGNIYANEALFAAGIHPEAEAGKVDAERLTLLTAEVKTILTQAIKQGGTTLKDFTNADGKPGYFAQKLHVYGRGGETCTECGHLLSEIRLGQRTTVFCSLCQTK